MDEDSAISAEAVAVEPEAISPVAIFAVLFGGYGALMAACVGIELRLVPLGLAALAIVLGVIATFGPRINRRFGFVGIALGVVALAILGVLTLNA